MAHPGDAQIPVPYLTKLGRKLKAGQTLNIHGRINSDATSVVINLLHGAPQMGPGQCVLHINLRFVEKKIVMSTIINEEWEKDERKSMPYALGEAYDLKIRVQEDGFEIWCDEEKVHFYKYHGMGYDAVEYLQIKGDCTLSGVHWVGRYYTIPYKEDFPSGKLRAGQSILVHAVPKGGRWNLDLLGRGDDILFHFNPRFKEKQIVRNSFKGGEWGREEREGPFPFKKNHGFNLKVENDPYSGEIQIFVNNERIGTFAHRTPDPFEDYTGMRIDGDVEVTNIEFV